MSSFSYIHFLFSIMIIHIHWKFPLQEIFTLSPYSSLHAFEIWVLHWWHQFHISNFIPAKFVSIFLKHDHIKYMWNKNAYSLYTKWLRRTDTEIHIEALLLKRHSTLNEGWGRRRGLYPLCNNDYMDKTTYIYSLRQKNIPFKRGMLRVCMRQFM